jgi:hypothetical protein
MKRCAADMAHTVGVDPFGEFGGNVRRPLSLSSFALCGTYADLRTSPDTTPLDLFCTI